MFTDVPSPHGILAHLRFRRRPLNNASSRYVQQKLFVMPPRGRGGKGGNKAYAGSHKGSNGGRGSKVIDLTEGGLGSSSFGNPLLYPMLHNPLMQFSGAGGMQMFGYPGLVGPQTNMCFAPTGKHTEPNSMALLMQQQMLMSQMGSMF